MSSSLDYGERGFMYRAITHEVLCGQISSLFTTSPAIWQIIKSKVIEIGFHRWLASGRIRGDNIICRMLNVSRLARYAGIRYRHQHVISLMSGISLRRQTMYVCVCGAKERIRNDIVSEIPKVKCIIRLFIISLLIKFLPRARGFRESSQTTQTTFRWNRAQKALGCCHRETLHRTVGTYGVCHFNVYQY